MPQALELLRSFVGTGAVNAPLELARILAEEGRSSEAIEVLTASADTGNVFARVELAKLLAEANRVSDALAILDDAMLKDDLEVRELWADIVAQTDFEGTLALLRAGTEQGNVDAARELARLLARDKRLDEALGVLRTVGRTECRQAELLRAGGRLDEAIEIVRPWARFRDCPESEVLADLLTETGTREELAARAEGGDGYAAVALARLWTSEDRAADATALLRATTASGSPIAAKGWTEHLASLGNTEDADKLRRFGLTAEGQIADHLPLPNTRFRRRAAAARKYASQDRSIRYDPATRPFWSPSDHLLF
jgi:hypothetical protein